MFYGEFPHSLDIKNRIVIPAKFRAALGDAFIITRGWDKCLTIYTMDEWRNLEEKVKALPRADEDVRRFMRIFFGGACECEPDAHGRVLIPQTLREHAGIVRDIVSVGVLERIEVWGKEYWDERGSCEIDDNIARVMKEFGI